MMPSVVPSSRQSVGPIILPSSMPKYAASAIPLSLPSDSSSSNPSAGPTLAPSDVDALTALFNSADGLDWNMSNRSDYCNWEGVTYDPNFGIDPPVVELTLGMYTSSFEMCDVAV